MAKRKSFRSELNQALSKSLAFYEHGNISAARLWAGILQQKLIDATLLIDNSVTLPHNAERFGEIPKP